ncbi:type II toxin-antitoxin system HicA family toxin [Patescibacteria group bacterium]|nr:type II toxin-antitoxin system HicA family toxin [Patescibacteria group bacterium]
MPRINPITWKKFEKFVLYIGCNFERQKGDHRIYSRSDLARPIVFPEEKDIPVFIIRNNLRVLDISTQEYLEILKNI